MFGGIMKDFNTKLEAYADLIIKVGIETKEGDIININCPLERADFGKM